MEVAEHPLFAGCDEAALEPVLRRLRPQAVPRGRILISERRGPARLYLVLDGALLAFGRTAEGRRVIFEVARPGGLDGILAAAGRRGHYTSAAVDSLVLPLPRAELQRLISADARVGVNLIEILMGRLVRREHQIEALAHADTVRRLARHLIAVAREAEEGTGASVVRVPRLTHQTLADMVGLRRETVTRALEVLVGTGALALEGRHWRLSPNALDGVLQSSAD